MKYWLTTHWPSRLDDPNPGQLEGVWLQDGKLHAANGMDAGDLVLIYESGSGTPVRERYPDGSAKVIGRHVGRQGVVTLARILDQPSEPENNQPEEYSDGSTRWWRYKAPTQTINSAGLIPRRDLSRALGYSTAFAFRGYGTGHSGLAELDAQTFETLRQRFIDSVADGDFKITTTLKGHPWGGPGGEGPVHLALKLSIAANPAAVLGEPGLEHWATEFKLPTGDTVDVVLKDEHGRFVMVEVEVDCDQSEMIGPLQCMKYRAMFSYLFKRHASEVRAVLVAHSIHGDVASQCATYQVESRVQPRKPS